MKALLYVLNRFLLQRKYLVANVENEGLKFKFRIEDAAGRRMYKLGDYENELTDYIKKNIKLEKDDIMLDVGANLGWYSLLCEKLFPGSKVYSFEPDPLNFSLLADNLKLNNSKNVNIYQMAVSDREDIMKLYLYDNKNRGRHSLLPINDGQTIDVKTITLNSFVEEQKINPEKIKFLKIDIEGYEYFALSGAKNILKYVKTIQSEYSPTYMKRGGTTPEVFLDLLYSYGFKAIECSSSECREISREDLLKREKNTNLYWIKDS